MKYFIETYGCQMNVHDSERMAGLLEANGYDRTEVDTDADLVVINTCSVRERAEDKLYTRLGEISEMGRQLGRDPVVAVTGCVAQQEGDKLIARSAGVVDVVVGTQQVKMLPMLASAAIDRQREANGRTGRMPPPRIAIDNPYEEPSFPLGIVRRGDPVRAYVTIIEGCNDFCAFCVVPYTRGHERMRAKAEILADAREAAASGRREVQLLGQIVNHYQAPDDPSCDFPALLEAVHEIPGIDRIRFASPHPRHTSERVIAAVRDLPKVCKHLHLPVQSGSSRVLGLMRRRHTREQYLDLVARIREAIPKVQLSTDMIVGFPGETDADFEETLTLTAAVGYHGMFSFKYLGAAEHAGVETDAGRGPRRGEDAAHRGAAGAATVDPVGPLPAVDWIDDPGAGRRHQPPARVGADGPFQRQHGGQLPGAAAVAGAAHRRDD